VAIQTVSVSRYTNSFTFQHIANFDGTSDSICLRCWSTITSSHNECSLEEAERTHICAQLDMLARMWPNQA
jgi:hypothetical protein